MEKKVYLAGAITGLSYGNATTWREEVKLKLNDFGIKSFSPMRGKSYLSKEDKLSDTYNNHTMSSIVGINVRDFNDVKTSDAILVNLLNTTKVSIGTVMEIAWARAFQIPVVIVMENENVHNHGMLTFGNIITNNIDDGVSAIIQLLNP